MCVFVCVCVDRGSSIIVTNIVYINVNSIEICIILTILVTVVVEPLFTPIVPVHELNNF